ncbi:MAG: hypothetical protein IKN29_05575 [Bacteroidales bacterium]|nr:hypothetical protein [Bacteroidales bacterium]
MTTKKKPTAAPAAAQGGAKDEKKMLTVSDERMQTVMRHVNRGLSKAHVTTVEMLIAARQMTVSALAQLCTDNPQASEMHLIDDVCADLRQSLMKRILPEMSITTKGEA